MLSSSAPSLSSLFRLVHFGFAATHMAGSVDFSIRQALLGAVWKLWHSEVAVDTQQTSAHIVLGGGNLCIEKAEVKHFTAQNKKVCCELGRPQLSLKLYSIFIIVLVQFLLMQLRRCGALLPLRFVCVCVIDILHLMSPSYLTPLTFDLTCEGHHQILYRFGERLWVFKILQIRTCTVTDAPLPSLVSSVTLEPCACLTPGLLRNWWSRWGGGVGGMTDM